MYIPILHLRIHVQAIETAMRKLNELGVFTVFVILDSLFKVNMLERHQVISRTLSQTLSFLGLRKSKSFYYM